MMYRPLLATVALLGLAGCQHDAAPRIIAADLPEPALALDLSRVGLGGFLDCLQDRETTILAAHRGGPAEGYPENHLATLAYNSAAAPMLFEVDVQETADGHYVLYHDETLEEDSNGSGRIADHTLAELGSVAYDNGGLGLSTLAEVLDWARGRTILQLDIKPGVDLPRLLRWLDARDAEEFALVITYNLEQARVVAAHHDSIMISASVDEESDLDALNAAGISDERIAAWTGLEAPRPPLWNMLDRRDISANYATYRSLDTWTGSPSNGAGYMRLGGVGLEILSTDHPLYVHRWMEDRQDIMAAASACLAP
ncbi:glycerophosphodiester phosphodiesterase family protein [Sphingomicrobium arenosum]|uniref:glycerophosphodiester phosphodiesterase family protein n=1 Tax=Sphingomicrobium arenosum TaxID=2233861 RepID=UPI00223FD21B|nr:glycerophosphodiester phosphodiesterase family protein [Sphingomicrobium arenosum]